MSSSRSVRVLALFLGVALVATSSLLGCGGTPEAPPFKEEDVPAVKGKASMDYFRNNMPKKKSVARKAA
jgi:hypothetical protein